MNRRPASTIPLAVLEADLIRRGLDPDFIAQKQEISGDVSPIVSRTEFLALQMRYGYQRAVALVRARIELTSLERELRATSQSTAAMRTALEAARVGDLGDAFRETAESTLRASHLRGAREGERALRQAEVRIRFDAMNPHAAVFARTQSSQLITQINESQREAVRNLIETSVSNGRTVQDIARDIRHAVGLRDDQVTALSNYRERITVRGTYTIDQIEHKVRRYADALLRQRGELIARTEVLHAANAGQLETWMEAQRQGTLGNDWRKAWITTPDELLCPACENLDDQVVDFTDEFVNDDGDHTLVPPLHPNCRCSMVLTKEAPTARAMHGSVQKYSPDQPRVPAGSPEGGQFTSDGGSAGDAHASNFAPTTPAKFIAARDRPGQRNMFLSQQTEAELQHSTCYLSKDGLTGYVLDAQGDLQNLFNNGGKGMGREALLHAIEHEAKTLDCFDGFLPHLYSSFGFVATGRMKFNDEYKPAGWDLGKLGRPDVVFMAYQGGARDTLKERIGTFTSYRLTDGEHFADWDAAKADSRGAVRDGKSAAELWRGVYYQQLASAAGADACLSAVTFQSAKYSPDQPRVPAGSPEGGQFAPAGGGGGDSGTPSETPTSSEYAGLSTEHAKTLREWQEQGVNYEAMRNPSSPEGKQLADALKELPVHTGMVYRGMVITPAQAQKLAAQKDLTISKFTSSTKDREVAEDFLEGEMEARLDEGRKGVEVLYELHTSGSPDLSALSEVYAREQEVVLGRKGGQKFRVTKARWFERKTTLVIQATEIA